jgi:hypothetical protein
VIKAGLVYQVKSYDEAKALIEGQQIAIHNTPAPKPPAEPIPQAAPLPAEEPAAATDETPAASAPQPDEATPTAAP